MKKLQAFLMLLLVVVAGRESAFATSPKEEFRAAWIATVFCIDWPDASDLGTSAAVAERQKALAVEMLDRFESANFNAVFFQIRSMCDAMYDSKYEPWSSNVSGSRGKTPAYDPLAFFVEECHKRGLECHAWINPLRFSTGGAYSTPNDNAMRNAGWLLTHGSTTVMNPALAPVRERIVDVCRDVLEKYDVDGIVFDDYWYPSGIKTDSSAADYDLWKQSGTADFGDWRRENVNKVVAAVYSMVQEVKPYVKFGLSPRGIAATDKSVAEKYGVSRCTSGYDSQYGEIFCDPLAWLKAGTLDYISPQIYWARGFSSGDFSVLCPWWADVSDKFGRHFYTSHSLEYFKDSKKTSREKTFEGIAAQVKMNRDKSLNAAPGAVFYSYSCVSDYSSDPSGMDFFSYIRKNAFPAKALTPRISWKTAPLQGTVENLSFADGLLEWTPAGNVRYAVYSVPEGEPLDPSSLTAERLLAHTYGPRLSIAEADCPEGSALAVTIVDRYGNEYAPAWYGKESGIADTEATTVSAVVEGDYVVFSEPADRAEIYDASGRMVAFSDAPCLRLQVDANGVLLVKIFKNGTLYINKVSRP